MLVAEADIAAWKCPSEVDIHRGLRDVSAVLTGSGLLHLKPTTGLFIDAERTKLESNVVPIAGFTL